MSILALFISLIMHAFGFGYSTPSVQPAPTPVVVQHHTTVTKSTVASTPAAPTTTTPEVAAAPTTTSTGPGTYLPPGQFNTLPTPPKTDCKVGEEWQGEFGCVATQAPDETLGRQYG